MQKLVVLHPLPLSSGMGAVWHDYEAVLAICHRRIKAATVPPVNLLYQAAITVSVNELIERRRFRMIYRPTSKLGKASHAHSHTSMNSFLIGERFFPAFKLPIKGFFTFITDRKTR